MEDVELSLSVRTSKGESLPARLTLTQNPIPGKQASLQLAVWDEKSFSTQKLELSSGVEQDLIKSLSQGLELMGNNEWQLLVRFADWQLKSLESN